MYICIEKMLSLSRCAILLALAVVFAVVDAVSHLDFEFPAFNLAAAVYN